MNDVSFDREQQAVLRTSPRSTLIHLVLASGVATTDRGAEAILLFVSICCVALAVALPLVFGIGSPPDGAAHHHGPSAAQHAR